MKKSKELQLQSAASIDSDLLNLRVFCEYLRNYPASCSISNHIRGAGIAANVFLIPWEQKKIKSKVLHLEIVATYGSDLFNL